MSLQYRSDATSVNQPDCEHPSYRISIYNGYAEFKSATPTQNSSSSGGGQRKKIKEFSRRSRKNMLSAAGQGRVVQRV